LDLELKASYKDDTIQHKLLKNLHERRDFLLSAKKFQASSVHTWNTVADEVSQLYLMDLLKFDETSTAGTGCVLSALYLCLGLFEQKPGTKGWPQVSVKDGFEERVVYCFGDCKSIDNAINFEKQIDMQIGGDFQRRDNFKESHSKASKVVHKLPGDLHGKIHMLAAIFSLFYGGFLQPFQAAMEFRNIKKDPKERLQKSADFIDLIGGQIQRAVCQKWLRSLSVETDESVLSNPVSAAKSYLEFKKACSAIEKDEVVRYTHTFLDMFSIYTRFCTAIRIGDSIAIEVCYLDFLPFFNYCKKHRYVELVLRQAEVLYQSLTPNQLHDIRCNRGVRFNKDRAKVANDEVCEIINSFYEKIPPSKTIEHMIVKSSSMAAMQQSMKFLQWLSGQGIDSLASDNTPDSNHEQENGTITDIPNPEEQEEELPELSIDLRPLTLRSTIKPKRTQTRLRISELIDSGGLLEPGKPIKGFSLWPCISQLKVPLKVSVMEHKSSPAEFVPISNNETRTTPLNGTSTPHSSSDLPLQSLSVSNSSWLSKASTPGSKTIASPQGTPLLFSQPLGNGPALPVDTSDDESQCSLDKDTDAEELNDLEDIIKCMLSTDINEDKKTGDLIGEDEAKNDEESQEHVLIGQRRMKMCKLEESLVTKPPYVTGRIDLIDGTLMKKRRAEQNRLELFRQKHKAALEYFSSEAGNSLSLRPIEDLAAWKQAYNDQIQGVPLDELSDDGSSFT